MENQEMIKRMEKSKLKLLAVFVVLLGGLGGVLEGGRYGQAMAEAVVIYYPQKSAKNIDVEMKDNKDTVTIAEKGLQKNEVDEKREAIAVSAEEFVQVLHEMHEKASEIIKPQSALAQIVVEKQKPELETKVVVDEKGVEIYDENGEAVDVVESVELPLVEEENIKVGTENTKEEAEVFGPVEDVKTLKEAEEAVKPVAEAVRSDDEKAQAIETEVKAKEEPLAQGEAVKRVEELVKAVGAVDEAVKHEEVATHTFEAVNTEDVLGDDGFDAVDDVIVKGGEGIEKAMTEKESAFESLENKHLIVNAKENILTKEAEDESGEAVDMMKDIIARDKEARAEK